MDFFFSGGFICLCLPPPLIGNPCEHRPHSDICLHISNILFNQQEYESCTISFHNLLVRVAGNAPALEAHKTPVLTFTLYAGCQILKITIHHLVHIYMYTKLYMLISLNHIHCQVTHVCNRERLVVICCELVIKCNEMIESLYHNIKLLFYCLFMVLRKLSFQNFLKCY
jgi:hypothetical protein